MPRKKKKPAKAIVLINTEIGLEDEVLESLRTVKGMIMAFELYGIYDIAVIVKAPTMKKLEKVVTEHIRRLDNLRSTLTMIVQKEVKLEIRSVKSGKKGKPVKAIVMINTEMYREDEVLESLRTVKGMIMAFELYGIYDIAVIIEAPTMDKLKEITTWHVRRLTYVVSTLTMVVRKEVGPKPRPVKSGRRKRAAQT